MVGNKWMEEQKGLGVLNKFMVIVRADTHLADC